MSRMPSPTAKRQVRYFHKPSAAALLSRFLLPVVVAYFAGFLISGVAVLDPSVQKVVQKHIPISPAPHSIQGPALRAGRDLQSVVWHYLTHQPEACSDGKAVNDFQREQCGEFSSRLAMLGWLASIPFLLAGGLFFVLADGIRMRFSRARSRIAAGRSLGRAVVTDPARAKPDLFSWWMGVTPVTVQGAEGRQLVACLPPEMSVPAPGASLTLYEWGPFGGKKRYFAVLYAPHLAVLQGG
jgi:hypothetical protein